MIMHR
jgi:hypothetical protein